jgi:glycosyltransferase involved in cell wall biosynthesis/pyruvate-formate lyase-activating enzyme
MKIAFFSPLSPLRSGISHYSEELLPRLARGADIDIYTDNYRPSDPMISDNFTIRRAGRFAKRRGDYDAVIYQMGNFAPFHGYMYRWLLDCPGIVVLHDYIYSYFYTGLTLEKGDRDGFLDIMKHCYGARGVSEAERLMAGGADFLRYAMNTRIIDSAAALIVHSEYIREKILRDHPGRSVRTVNMGVEFTDYRAVSVETIREKHGFEKDQFLIASLGMISPHKRIEQSLKAFAEFRKGHPGTKYLLVGEPSPQYMAKLESIVSGLGIGDDVVITGFLENDLFYEYLHMSDFCVNLRYPTAGETSATVLRAMEMGKPVAVTNYAQFQELPDECCIKVDVGEHERDLLVAFMRALAADRDLARSIGDNARRYVHEHHSPEGAAAGYLELLTSLCGREATGSVEREVTADIEAVTRELGSGRHERFVMKQAEAPLRELGLVADHRTAKRNLLDSFESRARSLSRAFMPSRQPPPSPESPLKCNEIFDELCVLADGRVVCSCLDSLAFLVLGDVHSQGAYDIFNNSSFQRLRRSLMNNRLSGLCTTCPLRNRPMEGSENLVMPAIKGLQIEIANACNLKCPECVVSHTKRPKTSKFVMTYEAFTDIIDQLKGPLELVKFYNYGEPFLHKDCMRMLRYIKETDPGIAVFISTNGTLIDAEKQKELVELGIDTVTFSVDGSSQKSYSEYRIGGNFEEVLGNMKGIVDRKRKAGLRKPNVIWQYILFEWNDRSDEIHRTKHLASEIQVDTLLWVLTHTKGASRKYTTTSGNLEELTDRKGFEGSGTQFVNSLTTFVEKNACDVEEVKSANYDAKELVHGVRE